MLVIGIIGSCFPCHNKRRGPRQYWWKFSAYIFYQFKYNLQSWNLHKSQIGKNKLGICWFASSLLTPAHCSTHCSTWWQSADQLQDYSSHLSNLTNLTNIIYILHLYTTTDVCVINFFFEFDTLNIKLLKKVSANMYFNGDPVLFTIIHVLQQKLSCLLQFGNKQDNK